MAPAGRRICRCTRCRAGSQMKALPACSGDRPAPLKINRPPAEVTNRRTASATVFQASLNFGFFRRVENGVMLFLQLLRSIPGNYEHLPPLRAVTKVVRHSGPHSPLCGSESGDAPAARPFRTEDCADHFRMPLPHRGLCGPLSPTSPAFLRAVTKGPTKWSAQSPVRVRVRRHPCRTADGAVLISADGDVDGRLLAPTAMSIN